MDALKRQADELHDTLVAWRRDLHRHPELGFAVHRTAGVVERELRALGLEVHTAVGETGVVGILRAPRNDRPGVLLRADMDALPIQEIDGREYGSSVPGCMHACGHDGHTSMLLGAARMLTAGRADLPGDVLFCFQPAEEGGGGGRRMIEDGILDLLDIGSVFGLHLWTPFDAGTAHVRPGPAMAAQDEFSARITGKGGHGAMPHDCVDPLVAAAQAVTALQSVVARSVNPIRPAVVTVGALHAGTAGNIIPEHATLEGTLRSFDEETRVLLRRRVTEVIEHSAAAAGCRGEVEVRPGYPAVVNDAAAALRARQAALPVFGDDKVIEHEPMGPAEDFAYFLRERPGAFVFVGAGNAAKGITAPHHSAAFDIDEDVLPRGAELLARLALLPQSVP